MPATRVITLSDWQSLMASNDQRYFVKGHELARQMTSDYRFAIVETRTWDGVHSGTTYRVRDAHTVSDDDVRAGITAKITFQGSYDECVAFINVEYAKEPT